MKIDDEVSNSTSICICRVYSCRIAVACLLTWTTNRCDCPDSPRDCWDFVSWAVAWSSPRKSRVHCVNSSSRLGHSSPAVWAALYVDTFHRYPSPLIGDRTDPRAVYSPWRCAAVSPMFSALSCRNYGIVMEERLKLQTEHNTAI